MGTSTFVQSQLCPTERVSVRVPGLAHNLASRRRMCSTRHHLNDETGNKAQKEKITRNFDKLYDEHREGFRGSGRYRLPRTAYRSMFDTRSLSRLLGVSGSRTSSRCGAILEASNDVSSVPGSLTGTTRKFTDPRIQRARKNSGQHLRVANSIDFTPLNEEFEWCATPVDNARVLR